MRSLSFATPGKAHGIVVWLESTLGRFFQLTVGCSPLTRVLVNEIPITQGPGSEKSVNGPQS